MANATGGYEGETKTPEETDLSDLDPSSREMARPHEHLTQRTVKVDRMRGQRQVCRCGAHRDVGLMAAGRWVGGEQTKTPWERAHLETVVRAVEKYPTLLELQPSATSDLHRTLLNDPPEETENRDLEGLEAVYGIALRAAGRLLDWQREQRRA